MAAPAGGPHRARGRGGRARRPARRASASARRRSHRRGGARRGSSRELRGPAGGAAGPEGAELTVRAPAFRKHQIRNLAGHLAAVALGLATPESLAQLARGLRPWHGATAPAHGLTLLEVFYPPELDPFR